MAIPTPPKTAGTAGRKLWKDVLAEYMLTGADLAALRAAVVLEDQLARLEPMLALGPVIKDADGRPVVNPALREYRLTADARSKQLAAAGVMGHEQPGETGTRSQRRAGFRGPYLKAVD